MLLSVSDRSKQNMILGMREDVHLPPGGSQESKWSVSKWESSLQGILGWRGRRSITSKIIKQQWSKFNAGTCQTYGKINKLI